MNILILDGNLPHSPHSGKIVHVANKIRELSRSFGLHYVYFPQPGETTEIPETIRRWVSSVAIMPFRFTESKFGRIRNYLRSMPWFFAKDRYPEDWLGVRKQLSEICAEKDIRVLTCFNFRTVQFALDLGLPVINIHGDSKSLHLIRLRLKSSSFRERLRLLIEDRRVRRYEDWILERADASIFLSDEDAEHYRKSVQREKICVIPNGVDTEYFSPRPNSRESAEPTVLFTGHMNYGPNVDAAVYLCRDILPAIQKKVANVRVIIAGADPTEEVQHLHDGKTIIVTGCVEDLRPYFEEAWVYLCPIRLGAGIKNKLLEAMAMRKAIVTTEVASYGISAVRGRDFAVADTPQEIAEASVRLFHAPDERRALGERARKFVEENYTWSSVGERHAKLIRQLIDEDRGNRNQGRCVACATN